MNNIAHKIWAKLFQPQKCFGQVIHLLSHLFLVFDIVDFYPSISKKLFTDVINFGKQYSTIDSDTSDIIFHCRKSVLFGKNSTWIKNNGSLFDVTMGSFDGAELCELVGLFLLSGLASIIGKSNVGLYGDDGLAILENTPGPDTERIKKKIIKFFFSAKRFENYN